MPEWTRPAREAGIDDLLTEEIARLLMRADRVERQEVEALMVRTLALRLRTTKPAPFEEIEP
ncbi:MAG TPA: hypothetical protein VLX09_04925 [Stellaceae bacterium]|nr:hypothetical protein [Stellaceae bacterium]